MTNGAEMFKGSLAAAEAARDTRAYSGLIAGLFEGVVRRALFTSASIPAMSGDAKEFLDTLRLLLIQKVDRRRGDRGVQSDRRLRDQNPAQLRRVGALAVGVSHSGDPPRQS